MKVFINEQMIELEKAKIHPSDRGFLLGDGVFTTFCVNSGKPLFFDDHWQRLQHSASLLQIPLLWEKEAIRTAISSLVSENKLAAQDAVVRITFTRGVGERGLIPPAQPMPLLLITAQPYTPIKKTLNVLISKMCRNEFSPLTNIKTINYLENILARKEANDVGADEALMLNSKGKIISAAAANLFTVSHGVIITAPLVDGVIAGIARQKLITLAQQLTIKVEEKSLTEKQLLKVDEMFLTNSVHGVMPVTTVNKNVIGNGDVGKITQYLQQNFYKAI